MIVCHLGGPFSVVFPKNKTINYSHVTHFIRFYWSYYINPFVHAVVPQPQTKHVFNLIIQPLSTGAEDCCGRGKTGNRRGHAVLISCFQQLTSCVQVSADSGKKLCLILCYFGISPIEKIFLKFPRFYIPDFKLVFCDKSFVRSGSSDLYCCS